MSVLRTMTWSTMDENARQALCDRGLEAIFDSDLKTRRADHRRCPPTVTKPAPCATRLRSRLTAAGLSRATSAELAEATVADDVDRAIDDAIAHLRSFNEQLMHRARDWSWRASRAWTSRRSRRSVRRGCSYPAAPATPASRLPGVPATIAGVPLLALVVPPVPDGSAHRSGSVVCRKLGIDNVSAPTVRRLPPWVSEPSPFHESAGSSAPAVHLLHAPRWRCSDTACRR